VACKDYRQDLTWLKQSRLVTDRAGATDGGQHLLIGAGATADQNLTFRVEGVSLHGGEISRDVERARIGRPGVAEV